MKRICGLCLQVGKLALMFSESVDFVDIEFHRTELQISGSVGGQKGGGIVRLTEQLQEQFAESDRLAVLNQSLGGQDYEF